MDQQPQSASRGAFKSVTNESGEPLHFRYLDSTNSHLSEPMVELHAGDKVFFTTRTTLCKYSAYFQDAFSTLDDYNDLGKARNLELYLDHDSELFTFVLRYMRHGIFPLRYSRAKGHDYVTYAGLLDIANRLRMHELERWLSTEQYRYAVQVAQSYTRIKLRWGEDLDFHLWTEPDGWRNLEIIPCYEQVYKCPFNFSNHTGPGACMNTCFRREEHREEDEIWEADQFYDIHVHEASITVDLKDLKDSKAGEVREVREDDLPNNVRGRQIVPDHRRGRHIMHH